MAKARPSLDTLGELIVERRGSIGVRAAAKEIGISSATLSRVENGHLPDLQNFGLICRWLGIDPNQILGFASSKDSGADTIRASVHFRKKKTTSPQTAAALAKMILHVQRALAAQAEDQD
ncbi:MAG TPA: helix-turn-helix transcriptional regulator [Woeseiaceae bacterium]|nr:helix-turn-helix transcriptional regulator [Woeseiaceae bacterium]